MSITTFPPSDPLAWKQADADVHVATRDGEFAGFVEFDGAVHLARDEQGSDLGSFSTLDDARIALEHAHHSRAQRSRIGAANRRRTPLRRVRRARV